ncbi:MAG: hypothetical protein GWN58_28560 [Anaerolineae bacterium]|nr:hypothetical protein [Anaerolineae bacterium]
MLDRFVTDAIRGRNGAGQGESPEVNLAPLLEALEGFREDLRGISQRLGNIRFPQLTAIDTIIFDQERIRDTDNRVGRAVLDLSNARHWGFEVINDHDQAVDVELLAGGIRPASGLGLVGVSATIAANTTEPILTDVWARAMTVRVSYATPPSEGNLTVIGFRQLWTPG